MAYPITQTIIHLKTHRNTQYISWKKSNYQANIIHRLSEKYNIDWKLIVAMSFTESSFDQFLGPRLEWGPMQVTPSLWKDICKYMPKTIEGGYECGIRYLKKMKDRHSHRNNWFAYYHSYTPKYKNRYTKKVNYQLKKINKFLTERTKSAVLYL